MVGLYGKTNWLIIEVSYIKIFISFLVFIIAFLLSSFIQVVIFRDLKENISVIKLFSISVLSNFGKYIPGKIWASLGYVFYLKKEGIQLNKSAQVIILHNIAGNLIGGIFLIGIMIIHPKILGYSGQILMYIIILLLLITVFVFPVIYNSLNRILYKWRFANLNNDIISISYILILKVLLLSTLYWLIMSIGFYYFSNGIISQHLTFEPYFIAILPASWTLGFIALFAPGGIGVRETALVFFLMPIVNEVNAVQISILSRIEFTIISLVLGLFSLYYLGKFKMK